MTDIAGHIELQPGLAKLPPRAVALTALLRHDPLVLFTFLSLLLLGGDLIAITAGGMTFRIVFPLLVAAFAFLYLRQGNSITFDRMLGQLFLLLAIAGAASVIHSYDAVKSIGYTIWVLFDFLAIITLCYNFAKLYPPQQVLALWFLVYRIHVFLLLGEVARNLLHGYLGRPHLWFYESSYLAVFMTGYFGSALYMFLQYGRRYAFDFILSLVGILATTAATGVFGMVLAVLLNFLVAKQRIKLLLASAAIGAALFGGLYLFFRHTSYYELIASFLFNGRLSFDVIISRSGDRWIRLLIGWAAFLHHPWLGIGIGGDSAYMLAQPMPESALPYVHPWLNLDVGQPFCNIIVEVMGTMGIAGLIPFAGIMTYASWSALKLMRKEQPLAPVGVAFFIGFFSIFLALQMEGTFLRYYLWSTLGFALGVMAQIRCGLKSPQFAESHTLETAAT